MHFFCVFGNECFLNIIWREERDHLRTAKQHQQYKHKLTTVNGRINLTMALQCCSAAVRSAPGRGLESTDAGQGEGFKEPDYCLESNQ